MNGFREILKDLRGASFVALATGMSVPVAAQTDPAAPVPNPPPSVEDFSLPPGDSSPAPSPTPTGPVDDASPPATQSPEPQPTPATPPVITSQPPAATPSPATVSRQPAPQPAVRTPQAQTQNIPPQQQAPAPTNSQPVAAPPSDTGSAETAAEDIPAETAPSPAEKPTELPLPASPEQQSTAEPADESFESLIVYAGSALALILLGGLGLLFWRRRTTASEPEVETTTPIAEPQPEDHVEELPEAPVTAANVESIAPSPEPEPKHEPEPATSGYVTTKIGQPEPQPAPVPASPSMKTPMSDRLHIRFAAERASTTLMNALVGYRLEIENRSNQKIKDLYVTGTMIQADKNLVETAASTEGQLLNEVGTLNASESRTVTGEIRLSLNAFQAIDFQSQKLFVPLVLLRFDYLDGDGKLQMQAVNYLVGTEHQPPRDKMAPFRLDLGPRNFGNLGHRQFQG